MKIIKNINEFGIKFGKKGKFSIWFNNSWDEIRESLEPFRFGIELNFIDGIFIKFNFFCFSLEFDF